ncbi:MAG: response regulator [Pseudomonadota bacterium]
MFKETTILVVDDDEGLRLLFVRMLAGAGYLPEYAENGRQALELLSRKSFSLVLLDIEMPLMSGMEVLEQLRKNKQDQAVIMVTGIDDPDVAKSAIELGINGYLIKPFEKNELLIYVEQTLRSIELEKKNREYRDSLEQKVQERTRELEKACRDLKSSQDQLLHQEKLATIGHLAAGVAHEINNPTGYVGSNLSTLAKYLVRITEFYQLLDDYLPLLPEEKLVSLREERQKQKIDFLLEDSREIITESLEGVERIKKIVAGLKSFSRKEQDSSSSVNINECLENAVTVAWNELKYKADVEKDYGDLPLIKCFPNQMGQVFVNLLVNAAHSIEGHGRITIRTSQEGDFVSVSICDTGCGMSPEVRDKIFDPFFTTKKEGVGTGLGLSIVSEIVKKHEGEIFLQSQIGKGSTFTVRIPVDRS